MCSVRILFGNPLSFSVPVSQLCDGSRLSHIMASDGGDYENICTMFLDLFNYCGTVTLLYNIH